MVDIYVLECEGGNFYVGMTDNGEKRLLQHVTGKGAKWTRMHKPKKIVEYFRNGKPSDEKDVTERMIRKHGASKVRGGPYVKTKMTQAELRALEKKVGMKPTKKKATKKTSQKRKVTCGRCGRAGHIRTNCRLKTTIDGVKITTKSWKYRPKAKSKPKTKQKMRVVCSRCFRVGHESRNCRARTKLNQNNILVKMQNQGLPKR